MDDNDINFLAHFLDGYAFRNTICIPKNEIERVTMILGPEKIEISFINNTKCAGHKIEFYTDELTMYRYNITDEFGDLYLEYPVIVDTTEFFNATKSIGRRDGVRLYWMKDDNKIHVQPMKTTTKDPGRAGALFVNIINGTDTDYTRYQIPEGYGPTPNIRVLAKDFGDICTQANTVKCTALEIGGESDGVTLRGILASGKLASLYRFESTNKRIKQKEKENVEFRCSYDIDEMIQNLKITEANIATVGTGLRLNIVQKDNGMTVRVPLSTVKSLSRIHNISPPGTMLYFYFVKGLPVKIESRIGTYGLYTICLRNPST